MSKDFNTNNLTKAKPRFITRKLWQLDAYPENRGLGEKPITNFNFVERQHYGVIDNLNNSVIPNEEFIVQTSSGRVFDFVADSFSLAKLNCLAASNQGKIPSDSFLSNNLEMVSSYSSPKLKYGRYLTGIFQYYNETHIPISLGNNSIASYNDYVKNFFNFFLNQDVLVSLTLTRWMVSNRSSILDTGLAFSFYDLKVDDDQRKYDEIINKPEFDYFKNLCLNMGFSINHYNPNILVYDLGSIAGDSIRINYGLYNLDLLFNKRFIKTHTIDMNTIYNNINLYYNKYVEKNSLNRVVSVKCKKTTSEYYFLSPVELSRRPHTDQQELDLYVKIRNKEEGSIFSQQKLKSIYRKSKNILKRLDKPSAISYINSMYRDQVWNKDSGYHDLSKKHEGKTKTEAQRRQTGGGPSRGGSSY